MTDELIRVLAEKLNIAVDGAASWLQAVIPQYCQMKAFSYGAGCFVCFVFFCSALFASCGLFKKYKYLKEEKKCKTWADYDRQACAGEWLVACCIFTISAFLLFCWLLVRSVSWGFFPDAMVLSTLISKC